MQTEFQAQVGALAVVLSGLKMHQLGTRLLAGSDMDGTGGLCTYYSHTVLCYLD